MSKPAWQLRHDGGGGETGVFFVTDDHPWLIEGQGWVETAALSPGQRIETADDRGLTITDIAITDRVARTYNLTVAGAHTFLVGDDGAVVHNNLCNIFFRSGHYSSRLRRAGVDPARAEAAVAADIASFVSPPQGWVQGRVVVDGVALTYRAMPQPNGTIVVGTIHVMR